MAPSDADEDLGLALAREAGRFESEKARRDPGRPNFLAPEVCAVIMRMAVRQVNREVAYLFGGKGRRGLAPRNVK